MYYVNAAALALSFITTTASFAAKPVRPKEPVTLVMMVNETSLATAASQKNFEEFKKHVRPDAAPSTEPAKRDFFRKYVKNVEEDVKKFAESLAAERPKLLAFCNQHRVRVILHTNKNLRGRGYEICDDQTNFRYFRHQKMEWQDFAIVEGDDFILQNQPMLSKEIFTNALQEGRIEGHRDYLIIQSHGGYAQTPEHGLNGDLRYMIGKLTVNVSELTPQELRAKLVAEVESRFSELDVQQQLRELPELAGLNFDELSDRELKEKFWQLPEFVLEDLFLKGYRINRGYLSAVTIAPPTPAGEDPKPDKYGISPNHFEGIVKLGSAAPIYWTEHGHIGRGPFKAALVASCKSMTIATRGSYGSGRIYKTSDFVEHDAVTKKLDVLQRQLDTGADFDDAFTAALGSSKEWE